MFQTYDEMFADAQKTGLQVTVVCGVNYAMAGRVVGANDKLICLQDIQQTEIYLDRSKILFAFYSPKQLSAEAQDTEG